MNNLLDEDLARLAQQGNKDAFAELVKRYEKQIFSMAYRLIGDYDEAADLAQEAFLRIYSQLRRYDPGKKFFSWMYRVAQNTCLNALAKKPANVIPVERAEEYFGDEVKTGASEPEQDYLNREIRQSIDQAIAGLPDNYRDVIYLRYIEDMSYQQIADVLNLPISTVETRLFRGKKQLQQRLKDLLR
ncbi:MAG TPA: sigma-70 family RNA polymerase sigma factor [Candidatus Avidehalobacter gallistercoris]|uniref:Sigma-70 family RNA polymerase sigma factor n=1 Tax=Candidatus Avidehalobacter gallistercoris TaxID=2840694 RepID=A0A9D1HJT8_9FIRM|nr:sigma-70 family RNA polymerase sigma factor [Candidatus Avidehalobacter gallistercoris]